MIREQPPDRREAYQPAVSLRTILFIATAVVSAIAGCSPQPAPDPWNGNPPAPYRADRHGHITAEAFAQSLAEISSFERPHYLADYVSIEGTSHQGDIRVLIRSVHKEFTEVFLFAPRTDDPLISPSDLDTLTAAMAILAPHIPTEWLPSSLQILPRDGVQQIQNADYVVIVGFDDYEPIVLLRFVYR